MINFLKQLLLKKSISPKDAGCQKIIHDKLKKIGFNCYNLKKKDTNNLWATYGFIKPIFCFCGHTDVVPSGNISLWKYDPFKGTVINGKIYGRGTSDMKGALVAQINAVENFIKNNKNIPGTIAFLITSDEEGNCYNGINIAIKILKKKHIKIDNLLIGEPSCINKIGDNIKIGRRGSINIKVIFYGKQGHIAYPEYSLNPINFSIPIINKINKIIWVKLNNYFQTTSLQFTTIDVRNNVSNIIPSSIELIFNIRFSPCYNELFIRNKILSILREYPYKFEVKFSLSAKPFIINKKNKLVQTLKKSIYDITKIKSKITTYGGVSDGRFLYKHVKNIIEFGLINRNIHKENEFILIKDLISLHDIYYNFLENFFFNKKN